MRNKQKPTTINFYELGKAVNQISWQNLRIWNLTPEDIQKKKEKSKRKIEEETPENQALARKYNEYQFDDINHQSHTHLGQTIIDVLQPIYYYLQKPFLNLNSASSTHTTYINKEKRMELALLTHINIEYAIANFLKEFKEKQYVYIRKLYSLIEGLKKQILRDMRRSCSILNHENVRMLRTIECMESYTESEKIEILQRIQNPDLLTEYKELQMIGSLDFLSDHEKIETLRRMQSKEWLEYKLTEENFLEMSFSERSIILSKDTLTALYIYMLLKDNNKRVKREAELSAKHYSEIIKEIQSIDERKDEILQQPIKEIEHEYTLPDSLYFLMGLLALIPIYYVIDYLLKLIDYLF